MKKPKPAQAALPEGWSAERVQKLVDHYEAQSEDEALDEDETPFRPGGTSMIEVPAEMVPRIRELIAKRGAA